LESTLRSTITAYLKAKSQLASISFQKTGNTALYKAGLISKIEFMNSEDLYQNAQIALWDANETLKKLLMGIGIEEQQIAKLSLNDIDKVKTIIAKATGELKIISPIEGVLSTQNKVTSLLNSTDVNKEITPGTIIKQNDVVAIIYEMTGLSFTIEVNETKFHDISVGQKASITGVAFPSITLDGYVKSINHEANAGSQMATPTYTIRIIVPNITLKQRELIIEGMSAEITLIKDQPPSIRVPIAALIHNDDGYFVKKINPVDGEIINTPVTAGSTDVSTVEIKTGLQEGDEIVIPD
jgi:multidrug efflux pump subunit AcrA (membrane-fusion protein)